MTANRFTSLLAAVKALEAAERKSLEATAKRSSMPPGSSRARVTSANADWSRKAEARDHAIDRVEAEVVACLSGIMLRDGNPASRDQVGGS